MFHSYASSSQGNLYSATDGRTSLLLECGLPIQRISYLLDLRQIAAALISHEHGDHAQAAPDLLRRGIPVWCSAGTARKCGIEADAERAQAGKPFKVGTFTVYPFETKHDAAEPLGFYICSALGPRLLFATDTYYLPNRFAGMSEIAVECNYSMDLLRQSNRPDEAKKRVLRSHMSLDTVLGFLQANDLSRVEKIWLLHMSDEHGHAEAAKRAVQEITGKVVEIC
jgi:phosphoribosyl 1,2-cyclic phosphodiesterase